MRVCIIGRPNVGKSSLFNRILGRRAAVVSDRDGVTRDRHYQTANYKGHEFTVVDTGGSCPPVQHDTMGIKARSIRCFAFISHVFFRWEQKYKKVHYA